MSNCPYCKAQIVIEKVTSCDCMVKHRMIDRTLHKDHDDIDVLKAQVDYLMEMLVVHWHERSGVYPGFTLADFMGIGDYHYAKWVETGTLKFVPMMDEKMGS